MAAMGLYQATRTPMQKLCTNQARTIPLPMLCPVAVRSICYIIVSALMAKPILQTVTPTRPKTSCPRCSGWPPVLQLYPDIPCSMVFIIRHNGRIFVGNNPVVQESIISAFHTNAASSNTFVGRALPNQSQTAYLPIQMDQVSLTSRIYTSLGASPFKVLYGHKPNHFGLSTDDILAPTDFFFLASWSLPDASCCPATRPRPSSTTDGNTS